MTRRRYLALGDLPAGVYPRDEDPVPGRPPRAVTESDKVPVFTNGHALVFQKTVRTSSQRVLSGRDDRIALEIFNTGTATVYVNFSSNATTGSIPIIAGSPGYYAPVVAPVNDVYMIADSGVQSVVLVEYSKKGTSD